MGRRGPSLIVVAVVTLVGPAASGTMLGGVPVVGHTEAALESVRGLLGEELHPHHVQSLALTGDLMAIHQRQHDDRFAEAMALAKRATLGQAVMTGYAPTAPAAVKGYALPSEALLELTARHGVEPSAAERTSMIGLDALREPLRGALARFVDAFLALDAAARVDVDFMQFVDEAALRVDDEGVMGYARRAAELAGAGIEEGVPTLASASGGMSMAEDFSLVGVDYSRVFPTRVQFLEAIEALRGAVIETGPRLASACQPVAVWPVFSFDVTVCDNTYHDSYALQFDLGGRDWYDNNAGGSNIWGGYFCGVPPTGMRAAAVDLGEADDLYGNPGWARYCGVNGGGFLGGMGFLLDDGGSDEYVANGGGSNGGAYLAASGFLLDVQGSDRYRVAVNGNGAGTIAWGMLIDTGGDDAYVGTFAGVNGEGGGDLSLSTNVLRHGSGFLLDTRGNDAYVGEMFANGGGDYGGQGFLVDLSGDDQYVASWIAGNGGGGSAGTGFLADASGHDTYQATSLGTNGGAAYYGFGMLVDLEGNDAYQATSWGTNGGGAGAGVGNLVDLTGDDSYVGGSGSNGAGSALPGLVQYPIGVGLLLDRSGTDAYRDALATCDDCTLVPKGTFGAQVDL